jgi:hypothetical protein
MQSYSKGKDTGYKEARQQNAKVEAEEYEKGWLDGVHQGLQAGEYNEQQKWLTEGHGPGLCISKEAHTHELW